MAQIVQLVIQKPSCLFLLLQKLSDFLYLLPGFLNVVSEDEGIISIGTYAFSTLVLFSCSPLQLYRPPTYGCLVADPTGWIRLVVPIRYWEWRDYAHYCAPQKWGSASCACQCPWSWRWFSISGNFPVGLLKWSLQVYICNCWTVLSSGVFYHFLLRIADHKQTHLSSAPTSHKIWNTKVVQDD